MTEKRSARPPLDLSVGELARRSGVAVSAIHFYEAEGLIAGWRTAANHRRYPRGVLRRLAIIRVAQRAGIPLKEIGEAFARCPGGPSRRLRTGRASRAAGSAISIRASTG
jgi:MerR family transcriptional regulator, redox-sensitive transcriptional activator SoxR